LRVLVEEKEGVLSGGVAALAESKAGGRGGGERTRMWHTEVLQYPGTLFAE